MRKSRKKYTPKELQLYKPARVLPFTGEWRDLVGVPERSGAWIVWGRSYSGKTSFCLQLAKYFADLGEKVVYLSLEEGVSVTMQRAFARECMDTVNGNLQLWCRMDMSELEVELKKQRSANVVVIDSLQYFGINHAGYKRLREEFPRKLFIFISHASETKEPSGATAIKVRYDASVKIMVDGFVAYAFSRYGGGKPLTIWEEGAKKNTTKKGELYGSNEEGAIEDCEENEPVSGILRGIEQTALSADEEGSDIERIRGYEYQAVEHYGVRGGSEDDEEEFFAYRRDREDA